MTKLFLVEIRLKDWMADLPTGGRVIAYEEVEAEDDYVARLAGFDQFIKQTKTDKAVGEKWQQLGLKSTDICAPDAVMIG